MKKRRLIFLTLMAMSFFSTASAQNSKFNNQEATLHNFMFVLTDEFQLHLEDLARENLSDHIEIGKDPVAELFMHESYNRIEAAIEAKTGLEILPKETLEGKVAYDIYDYPAGNKKKAAKRGNTPFYLKLYIQMSARDIIDNEVAVSKTDYKKRKIKPHVLIKATLFDKDAKEVFKSTGKAKGDRWIVLDRTSLWGFITFDGQTVVDEQETLLSVLDEAIEDLKKNLP